MILLLELEEVPYCFSFQRMDSWKWSHLHTITEPYRRLLSSFLQYQCLYCWVVHLEAQEISQEPAEVHSEKHLQCLCSTNSKVTSVSAKNKNKKRPLPFHKSSWTLCVHGFQRVKPKGQKPFLQRGRRMVCLNDWRYRRCWGAHPPLQQVGTILQGPHTKGVEWKYHTL